MFILGVSQHTQGIRGNHNYLEVYVKRTLNKIIISDIQHNCKENYQRRVYQEIFFSNELEGKFDKNGYIKSLLISMWALYKVYSYFPSTRPINLFDLVKIWHNGKKWLCRWTNGHLYIIIWLLNIYKQLETLNLNFFLLL